MLYCLGQGAPAGDITTIEACPGVFACCLSPETTRRLRLVTLWGSDLAITDTRT